MADKVQLIRPEVAAKYECTLETDIVVHAGCGCYSGKISNVNMSGADNLYQTKTGYLVLKTATEE